MSSECVQDDWSSHFTSGHGLKKQNGSVLFDISDAWDKGVFKSDYISLYLHNWMVLHLCIVFAIGESPRACSKYSH